MMIQHSGPTKSGHDAAGRHVASVATQQRHELHEAINRWRDASGLYHIELADGSVLETDRAEVLVCASRLGCPTLNLAGVKP